MASLASTRVLVQVFAMFRFLGICVGTLVRLFCSRQGLLLENLALRQQVSVLKRRHPRPRLDVLDRLFCLLARRLVRMETSSPRGYTRNRGPVAPRWTPLVLGIDFEGQETHRKNTDIERSSRSDLPNGPYKRSRISHKGNPDIFIAALLLLADNRTLGRMCAVLLGGDESSAARDLSLDFELLPSVHHRLNQLPPVECIRAIPPPAGLAPCRDAYVSRVPVNLEDASGCGGDVSYRGSRKSVDAHAVGVDRVRPTDVMGRSAFRLVFAVVFVLASFFPTTSAQENPAPKNVLVLNSFTRGNGFPELEPLKATVRSRLSVPVNFYVEYLDSVRFVDPAYRESLSETLLHAYSGAKLDLVVVSSYPALRFALDYRDRIFPRIAIVFLGVDPSRFEGQKIWPGVTGLEASTDVRGSLDLALRLHPETQGIVLIAGVSEFETYWNKHFREEMRLHFGSLRLIELIGLPPRAILDRMATFPEHTIVFAQIVTQDSADPVLNVFDVLKQVGQRFPTYSMFNYCFDHGCVGGSYMDQEEDGRKAGGIAARILSGESPESIPVEVGTASRPMVDWRELRHWNIPESALPSGTVVLYREPTLWERGRKYFLTAIGVIVVQTLLIFGLLWQRARKREAEAVLRESEKRFRVMADSTPSLIWMCDQKGEVTYLNEQWVAFTGSSKNAGYGDMWTASVHPDDLQNVLDTFKKALIRQEAFSSECRLRRGDGVYRWMFGVASPRVNGDGSFAGFIASAVDVSDQKTAQEALENVSGQLIEAQEKERSRLARELHDDICQRLAMLSLKIEKVSKGGGRGQVSVADQLEQIWQQCSDLTGDVQALSHELHPSILDHLGLTTAVKSFCREVSEQNGVVVEFSGRNIPNTLPREISLSLFRVAQEAIHNAMKYSGEKHFEVRLQAKDTEIELEVSDRGIGFDTASIKNGNGLGLVSMAERIHQINGTFKIDSEPNNGTRIHARVPLATQPKAMTAAAN